jgi:hypothetical protein
VTRRRAGWSPLVLATLLVPLLSFPALASGEVDVRRDGSHWARIEKGGTVRIDGRIVGRLEPSGDVRVDGRIAGRVEGDGTIRDDGRIAGRVAKDGSLRSDGTIIGRIENGGGIRRDGSLWGSASPCCSSFDERRRVGALLYFFEPGFFQR